MRYANIIVSGAYQNSIFSEIDPTHVYAPTFAARELRRQFLDSGIELNTPDLNEGREIAFEIYVEGQKLTAKPTLKFLVAMENPNINLLNGNRDYCQSFQTVFSWNLAISQLENGVEVLVPQELKIQPFPSFEERPIFSCLINANKRFSSHDPDDLYRERLKLIRWYEKNCPEHFALYGRGWNKPGPAFSLVERLNRSISRIRTKLFSHRPFPSYRGEVSEKSEIYSQAKFAYCYENSKNISNYITEKIFDAMVCGCVPIYWGADNVRTYIPASCFIDRRNFQNQEDLNDYLEAVDSSQYLQYQANIRNFLQSKDAHAFSAQSFAERIAGNIMGFL